MEESWGSSKSSFQGQQQDQGKDRRECVRSFRHFCVQLLRQVCTRASLQLLVSWRWRRWRRRQHSLWTVCRQGWRVLKRFYRSREGREHRWRKKVPEASCPIYLLSVKTFGFFKILIYYWLGIFLLLNCLLVFECLCVFAT